MRYTLSIFLSIFFIACTESPKNVLDNAITEPVPVIKLDPQQTAIHAALIDIMTKDIESSGNTVKTIQIDGMEIMKISKKDYYNDEMAEQETNFNNYLQYLSKFSKTRSVLNDPAKLKESQAKHNAVISYLKSTIKRSSSKPEIYKVIYYLKADTKNIKYDQLKTTYLDKEYKKMVSDYSFLK